MHGDAVELLRRCGAEAIDHPGGTLFAHLLRVERRLGEWRADDRALRLAGLCHACYGTDGFAASLLDRASRGQLAGVIGARAEGLVYRYAAADRAHLYPQLGLRDPVAYRDRFTGVTDSVPAAELAWFLELTAANELDIAEQSPAFRAEHGPGLREFFGRTRELLGPAAWQDCREVLGGPA